MLAKMAGCRKELFMLAAKIDKAKFDSLSDALKAEYKLQSDGSYLLDVSPVNGFALEDVTGLKTALSQERSAKEAAERKVEAFKDIDPTKAKEAIAKVGEMANWTPEQKVKEQIEVVKTQLSEKHTGEKGKLEAQLKKLAGQLEKIMVDAEASKAIAENKGSIQLLLPHVRASTRIKVTDAGEFIVEVVDDKGNVRLSPAAGSTAPMSVVELVSAMKTNATFAPAFAGSGASGTGASGGGAGGGTGGNQFTLSAADSKDPAKYRAAKEAAAKAGQQLIIEEAPRT
jgi:hypothetical protein